MWTPHETLNLRQNFSVMINCDVSVHTTVSKFYMQLSIVKKKKKWIPELYGKWKHLYYKLFRYQIGKNSKQKSCHLPLITARCRWHTCAAPSGSSAAPRCVWLGASCLWTARSDPGSETTTYGQIRREPHLSFNKLPVWDDLWDLRAS